MKKSGILLPVSSLPAGAGIGDLGRSAFALVRLLEEHHINIWQILPLNPLGFGNSPYQPYSSYAGDEIYLSLEELAKAGLIPEQAEDICTFSEVRVDYDAVRAFKTPFLREASKTFFSLLHEKSEAEIFANTLYSAKQMDLMCADEQKGKYQELYLEEFQKEFWLQDYIDFCVKKYDNKTEEFKDYILFVQFMFAKSWRALKFYANALGVEIMGDVPFYVGFDSADVQFGKENFLLDKDNLPTFIAGVPPDYFSETGQRWGNPIYDWEYLKKTEYRFWTNRMSYSAKLFDIVRVDHFRAFDTYWKIPASCPTAIEGEWVEAPGYEVLDAIIRAMGKTELIAEDLGDLREEVRKLKDDFHLKGMKIFEFDFHFKGKYAVDVNIPKDASQIVFYTGTHDNATLVEWYEGLSKSSAKKLRKFLSRHGFKNGSMTDRVIGYILNSDCAYAILSMPDVLGLGKSARMNTPGTIGSPNWEWRLCDLELAKKAFSKYKMDLKRQ